MVQVGLPVTVKAPEVSRVKSKLPRFVTLPLQLPQNVWLLLCSEPSFDRRYTLSH